MKNKTILITGGSSGIGLEMAKFLVKLGNKVIVCGRSKERLENAKEQIPELVTIQCDITKSSDRETLHEKIIMQFGHLDMLINNAGMVKRFLIAKNVDLENEIIQEWQTNYLAPVLLTQKFINLLSSSKGTVVNVSSGLAYLPLFIQPNYCATKAALHSMSLSMRIQFNKIGINVVEIFFPAVDTPFQQGYTPKDSIKSELAAQIAIQGLIKGKNEIHVKNARLIFLLSRIMPNKALKIISGFVPKNFEEILANKSKQAD
jgi:uncharacterized oxidoreductase